jgi:hypothetical protein
VAIIDRERLKLLEQRLGAKLPTSLVATLVEREPIHEGNVVIVAPDRIWDIRSSFSLDDGDSSDQLDRMYELVGDVLPPAALPIAEDWGGNFYCVVLSGPLAGQVVFWDHERDEGDVSVESVAESLESFYSRLVPDPRA